MTSSTPQDPSAFLRATAPFQALPPALFDEAARSLEVGFWPAGTRLVEVGGEPLRHLYVIRKGSVRLEREGQSLQILEEGECFGYTSLITRRATLDVTVEEDLLAYLLPAATFERLLADATFAAHFAAGLGERLRASLEHAPVATFQADLALPVERLLRGPAVWLEAGATVGDAARAMTAERISSVLVRGDPPGIVTDRDFRSRVLAQGRGPETPLADVASRPVRGVPAETPVYDAWSALLDAGVHHLAVTRRGEIAGVLSSTDLLKHNAQGPVSVLRSVERLAGREALPGYAGRVAEMVSSLLAGGLDVAVIAGFVARLNDALVRRILAWAEADLGPPPAPYAWLALGSEGRMEQTLLTDQDNAIAFADAGAPERHWYQALASRANEDLVTAGFPPCPGGYMASRWSGTLGEWRDRFAEWTDVPRPQALLEAAIFFDFRSVAGALDVGPLHVAALAAAGKGPFLRFLARNALAFRPPASLVLRLRESAPIDLKRQGIAPVVLLARCYAIEARADARGTAERLAAVAKAGIMDASKAAEVSEAYQFLLGLRLRLQLQAIADGKRPTDAVALGALTGVQRSRLKDSLRAIRAFQERAAHHFQAEF